MASGWHRDGIGMAGLLGAGWGKWLRQQRLLTRTEGLTDRGRPVVPLGWVHRKPRAFQLHPPEQVPHRLRLETVPLIELADELVGSQVTLIQGQSWLINAGVGHGSHCA